MDHYVHIWGGKLLTDAWCGARRTREAAEGKGRAHFSEITCPECLRMRSEASAYTAHVANRLEREMWRL